MNDFEKLVKAMRDTQKKYFRTREYEVLRESKNLEKQVDRYIKNIEQPLLDF